MDDRSIAREMRLNRHSLDEDSATRMLQGAVHPDDAPPGYGSVAGLLAAASARPTLDEDAGAATIAAMVEAIRDAGPVAQPRRKPMLGKLLAGKAIAAVAVLGLTATGAVAAAGSLPEPVQGVVSDAVSHVGVDIPHPNHGKSAGHRQDGDHRQDGEHRKDGTTTSTSGKPAKGGTDGTAGDSAKDNKGQVISGVTHDPALDGQPKGPVVCAEASDGRCRAGEDHGKKDGTSSTTSSSSTSTTVTTSDSTTTTDDSPGRSGGHEPRNDEKAKSDKGKAGGAGDG